MGNYINVTDPYRKNPLSTKPGGSVVKAEKWNGQILVYDKIKNPRAYIDAMHKLDIRNIWVDDQLVWAED